jgi:hypothetical protein
MIKTIIIIIIIIIVIVIRFKAITAVSMNITISLNVTSRNLVELVVLEERPASKIGKYVFL